MPELRPGKRENGFYCKSGLLCTSNYIEERKKLLTKCPKIYVYDWDAAQRKHVGHLVDTESYLNRRKL